MPHTLRTVAVSILALALLGWFLRDANLADVWHRVASLSLWDMVVATSLLAPMMLIRAVRWRCLLRPVGPAGIGNAMKATVIGFAISNVLPARAGEVLRPYLLARKEGLPVAAAFATIVIERVLDLGAVLGLLGVFVWSAGDMGFSAGLYRTVVVSAGLAAAAAVVLLAVMATLASHPERIATLVLRTSRVLPAGVAQTLSGLARTFSEGLAISRMPAALAEAICWSFLLWVCIAGQSWMVTNAFGIRMPFTGSFLLQALLVVGIAVPTPGGVGGFHEAYRLGTTTFFGAEGDAAIGAALVLHAMSFIPTTVLGVLFMLREGLSLRRLRGLAETVPSEELPVAP